MQKLAPDKSIEQRIFLIRGQKVMLSLHLAELYQVDTRALNQAVKRNPGRFPEDFLFRLNDAEARNLVSQNVIPGWKQFGGSLPYAFTEQGVAMLSTVLRSERAISMNIAIMRTFVKLREYMGAHSELARKLVELELRVEKHDDSIVAIFDAIRRLMQPPEKPKRPIGFKVGEPKARYRVKRPKL